MCCCIVAGLLTFWNMCGAYLIVYSIVIYVECRHKIFCIVDVGICILALISFFCKALYVCGTCRKFDD